jgi:hypothetical protein
MLFTDKNLESKEGLFLVVIFIVLHVASNHFVVRTFVIAAHKLLK